ncbi:hypothetical protein EDB85DRAFT_1890104 [Lactarius pseudohatsudake]|nr:hypothetical protein EDB85DRAFT_1890104 [Lactarius pseudohatsudake]
MLPWTRKVAYWWRKVSRTAFSRTYADRFTNRVIHLKEISVDFIKTRPTSDLELVLKDDAGVTHKSDKFKNGALVLWELDIYFKTHTSATLTIQRALFKITVAKVSVEFKPYKFGDDKVVRLEGGDVLFLVKSTSC